MKSAGTGIAVGALVFLMVPVAVAAQEPQNNFSAQRVADYRCAAGTGAANGFNPIAPGAVCLEVPATDASALECKDVKDPKIVSRCDGGKCVAKEMCNKPLSEKPIEIPGGGDGDDPLKPVPEQPTDNGTSQPSPGPTQPSPVSPQPSLPSTGSGGTGGNGTGGGAGNVPGATGENALPTVDVIQDTTPAPRPGTTFTNTGNPFTLGPNPRPSGSGATFGESPGNVFGDPWGGNSNTTFTGSFGGTGWGSSGTAAGINLFSNFISAIGSLFGGFGGGGGSGSVSAPNPAPAPVSNPAPTPRPAVTVTPPQSPPQQVADAGEMPDDVRNELENYFRLPQPTMTDRTGLDDLLREMTNPRGSVTGPAPQPVTNQPGNINNPAPMPQDDFKGIEVPQPDPAPTRPSTPTPRPITRELATLEVERTRGALEGRSTFDRFLDWVGIGSAEGVAYQRAQQALRAASMREGLERIAADVRAIPDAIQVAEGGPVMTDAQPIDIGSLEKMLTPQQRAQFEREYDELVREFDAAQTDEERSAIINRKFDEIRAIDPAIDDVLKGTTFEIDLETEIAAPAPQPVLSPSRMLEGLSRIGERVRDAAQRAAGNVVRAFTRVSDGPPQVSIPDTSLAEPLPEPAAPENPSQPERPAPSPAPQPPQTASRPSAFLQGGLGILSALLGTVFNFFGDDGSSSPTLSQPSQPAQPAAAASITANPPIVDDGDTSELSWTSVGTLSCVVVDSLLNVIERGGKDGALVTPALSVSTRFGVICDIEEGRDKFVNEALVRVNGDENEPERLFAQSGRVSTAAPVSGSASDGGTQGDASVGQTSNPQPIDVRTCDPEQSMDTFIKCLCEAEPNPNGCSLVQ